MNSQRLISFLMVVLGVFLIYVLGNTAYNSFFKKNTNSISTSSITPYNKDAEHAKKLKEIQKQNQPSPMDETQIEPEGDAAPADELVIENCYQALFDGVKVGQYQIMKIKMANTFQNKLNPLYTAVKTLDAKGKAIYFEKNINDIEKFFGITKVEDFLPFTDSLKFIDSKVQKLSLNPNTINISPKQVTFTIDVILQSGNRNTYKIVCDLIKSTNNQGAPYVTILQQ